MIPRHIEPLDDHDRSRAASGTRLIPRPPEPSFPASLLALQRSAGNAAVSAMLAEGEPPAAAGWDDDEAGEGDATEYAGGSEYGESTEYAGGSEYGESTEYAGGSGGDSGGEYGGESADIEPAGMEPAETQPEETEPGDTEPAEGFGSEGLEAGAGAEAAEPGSEWTQGGAEEGEAGAAGHAADTEEGTAGEAADQEGGDQGPDIVVTDPYMPGGGGEPPAAVETDATTAGGGRGFVDAGRAGTTPIGPEARPDEAGVPHAFIYNGETGRLPWSGGGPGGGPKGEQGTGSISPGTIPPNYVGSSTGWFSAEGWVEPGTGTVDVVRSWYGAVAGDQRNGWFVTPRAAARLDEHERKHVTASRGLYDRFIAPVLSRIAVMGPTASHTRSSLRILAERKVEQAVGWEQGLENFTIQDKLTNSNGGTLDSDDRAARDYPHGFPGPFTIDGSDYRYLLKDQDEPDPT